MAQTVSLLPHSSKIPDLIKLSCFAFCPGVSSEVFHFFPHPKNTQIGNGDWNEDFLAVTEHVQQTGVFLPPGLCSQDGLRIHLIPDQGKVITENGFKLWQIVQCFQGIHHSRFQFKCILCCVALQTTDVVTQQDLQDCLS